MFTFTPLQKMKRMQQHVLLRMYIANTDLQTRKGK